MRITFRVGSNGQTSGIAVLAARTTTLVVTVLPKLWRGAHREVTDVQLDDAPSTFVTVHENDCLRLHGSAGLLGAVADALSHAHVTDLGAAGSLLEIVPVDETSFFPPTSK